MGLLGSENYGCAAGHGGFLSTRTRRTRMWRWGRWERPRVNRVVAVCLDRPLSVFTRSNDEHPLVHDPHTTSSSLAAPTTPSSPSDAFHSHIWPLNCPPTCLGGHTRRPAPPSLPRHRTPTPSSDCSQRLRRTRSTPTSLHHGHKRWTRQLSRQRCA